MTDNYNDYRYDSCTSRGICSINPKSSSLLEVILLYLKHTAYYTLKLEEFNNFDERIKKLVIYSVSVMTSNNDFSETDFMSLQKALSQELLRIIDVYKKLCKENNKDIKILKPQLKYKKNASIVEFIRIGESEYNKKNNVQLTQRNLYRILFLIIKSLCINIVTANDYDIETKTEYHNVLLILESLIEETENDKELKQKIIDISNVDSALMERIRNAQINKYGEQKTTEVSYSTKKGKAILVVGADIVELEKILKYFPDIDIYTHDELLLAHTFPKFKEYKNLIGQYGRGMENCLVDFSTFPGPIIVTRNSLFNVENLYRGRLFTTDWAHSKGVTQIKNSDYLEVKESLNECKGFKTGKNCESETVGVNYKELMQNIELQLNNQNYEGIFVLGHHEAFQQCEKYYNSLLEHIPNNYLIIALFCCNSKNSNLICANAGFDTYLTYFTSKSILEITDIKVNIIIPVCKRHTITDITTLSQYKNANLYWNITNCSTFNPSVMESFKSAFNINTTTTPKADLKNMVS